MANLVKACVKYYPVDVNPDFIHRTVERVYGVVGIVFLYKLNCLLGGTPGHYIRCQTPLERKMFLADTAIIDKVVPPLDDNGATEILTTLAELGYIDQELWNHRIIWSQQFVDSVSDAYRRAKNGCPMKPVIMEDGSIAQTTDRTDTADDYGSSRSKGSRKPHVPRHAQEGAQDGQREAE